MTHIFRRHRTSGFTLVELIIVIVVIGILAALSIVAYNGVTSNARDKALLSDIDNTEAEITRYSAKHGGVYDSSLSWNSSQGANPNIPFTPSAGNVIVVTASGDGYCIKAYNPASNAKTLASAIKRGGGEVGCPDGWTTIASSWSHTCAIASDSNAYCWGNGGDGRLGNGTDSSSNVPVAVTTSGALAGKTIKQLEVGSYNISTICTIASDDNAYCWGKGTSGQLGNGTPANSNAPVAVTASGALAGKTIKQLKVGGNDFVCAIASDSNAYCWGNGTSGQLGNGTPASSNVPVAVTTSGALAGKTIKQLEVGASRVCVIASDNNAYCWGIGTSGQLGNNALTSSSVPVAVTTSGVLAGKTIKQLVGQASSACVIASDDNAYCWGSGDLGNGSSSSKVPVAVTTSGVLAGKTIKQLVSGTNSLMCLIASDNNAYCWGGGGIPLGNGSSASSVPVAVTTSGVLAGKTIKQLLLADSASSPLCAIASDNNAYCWGSGTSGQLGNGVPANSYLPVAVTTSGVLAGKTIKQLEIGGPRVCVIASDNNAYCWGDGGVGQLGNGYSSNSNVPVLVTRPEGI